MKTHRSTVKWMLVAVAIGAMIGWIAYAQEKPRLEKSGIVLPGAAISKDDQKAMNKILKQYDKSLYRIDTYEKGQLKKTRGTLSDVVIGQKLTSEVAENAKKNGFTQYAIRIGVPEGGVGHHPTPASGMTVGGVPHAPTPTPGTAGMTAGVGHATPPPTPGTAGMTSGVGHNTPPPPGGGIKELDTMDSEELVKRLKPILEKYNKQ
jgi:hypothetical protein